MSSQDDDLNKEEKIKLKRSDKIWVAIVIGIFVALFVFIFVFGLDFLGI